MDGEKLAKELTEKLDGNAGELGIWTRNHCDVIEVSLRKMTMLEAFKEFLRGLEQAGSNLTNDHGVCSVLTQNAFDALVELTRAVYGDTAAHVVDDAFTQREDGSMVVSGDLTSAFSDSIKGPT